MCKVSFDDGEILMQQLKAFRMLLRSTFLLSTNRQVRQGVIRPLNAKRKFIRKTSAKSVSPFLQDLISSKSTDPIERELRCVRNQ